MLFDSDGPDPRRVLELGAESRCIYVGGAMVGKLIIGMTAALILNAEIKARNFWRSLLFLPWAIPAIVSAYTWKWIYNDVNGVINNVLMQHRHHRLRRSCSWPIRTSRSGRCSSASIWQGTPFWTMTFLAGLQSIPGEMYEAAEIDGASTFKSFLYITLPSIASVIIVTLMLSAIFTINGVQFIYILTNGGPADATQTFPLLALAQGLRAYDLGIGSTIPLRLLPGLRGDDLLPDAAHAAERGGLNRWQPLDGLAHPAARRARSRCCTWLAQEEPRLLPGRLRAAVLPGLVDGVPVLLAGRDVVPAGRRPVHAGRRADPARPDPRSLQQRLVRRTVAVRLQFMNSLIVAVATTLIAVVLGVDGRLRADPPALLRARLRLARVLVYAYLAPGTMLFIPLFVMMNNLGLRDSLVGLVLAHLTFSVPFATWMLMGYFKTIPIELEEAALVDGASRLTALWRIILPLAAPAIVVVAVFAFTLSWNEFLYALVLVQAKDKMTAPIGLTAYVVGDTFYWGQMMAAATIMSLPPLLLYLFGQRWVIQGWTAGAVKS